MKVNYTQNDAGQSYYNFQAVTDNGGAHAGHVLSIFHNGRIGVGTISPQSYLDVNGAATNASSLNANGATTINFGLSNLAYTDATTDAITLTNIKDGGAYSLIFTNTTVSSAVTFSASGYTFKYMGTGNRTNGKAHIYSFIVAGTVVYVTMATEN
jgi:hypothetical protein